MELRKVKFDLNGLNGTIGDYESAGENPNEKTKERYGLFQTWGNVPFWDAEEGRYHDKIVGIVEEEGTGVVYHVTPNRVVFIDKKN